MSKIEEVYAAYVNGAFGQITLAGVVEAVMETSGITMWRHPLGFYHAELTHLVPAESKERFRLHVWLDAVGSSDSLGDLHEHTWDLTSLVLAGSVRDSNFSPVASPSGRYMGSRIRYDDVNTAESVGSFDLVPVVERKIEVGEHYQIPSRTIHLNSPGSIPTVTLVRSLEDQRGDGPLVLSPKSVNAVFATGTRERVDLANVMAKLNQMLASAAHPEGRARR